MNWREHVIVDPEICHGSACIVGTRVLVTAILDNLAAGLDEGQIVESYPSITRESVRAAVCYAAELAKGEDSGVASLLNAIQARREYPAGTS